MKIITLQWSWMFSYGPNNSLHFDKTSLSQLTGTNGNGKTSIALILQELLYSKNVKGIKKGDILNRYSTSKTWSGRVTFQVDRDLYDLSVERTGDTSRVRLLKNGDDVSEHKILDTYRKIQQIIGMPFEVFCQLTYQSSTDLLDFIKATDTNRKRFLINLFGLERYIEIGEQIKTAIVEVEQQHTKIQGELQAITRFLEENKVGERKELKPILTYPQDLEVSRAQLHVQLQDFTQLCAKIDKNRMLVEERDNLRFDAGLQRPIQDLTVPDEIRQTDSNLVALKQEQATIERNRSNIDTSDSCYACGQHIDNSKGLELKSQLDENLVDLKIRINKLSTKIVELRGQESKERIEYQRWIANQRAIERFEQLCQLIDNSLPNEYPDYGAIKREYSELSEKLLNIKSEIEQITRYNEQVHIHNTKVETLRDQRRDFLARQELLDKSIINFKSKINHLSILKKAFSTSGIVAFKLENLTKQLESTINHYLAELSDGQFSIIFRLNGEKLNIVVANNGKETPIETVSGGEFGRIQTSILLAIRTILSKIGGTKVNTLFLDEITGVLDSAGKERLVEILLQEEANTFFISHDFEHPLIQKIYITKHNNLSKIGE